MEQQDNKFRKTIKHQIIILITFTLLIGFGLLEKGYVYIDKIADISNLGIILSVVMGVALGILLVAVSVAPIVHGLVSLFKGLRSYIITKKTQSIENKFAANSKLISYIIFLGLIEVVTPLLFLIYS